MPKIENTFGLKAGTVYSMWATSNALVAITIAKKRKDFKKVIKQGVKSLIDSCLLIKHSAERFIDFKQCSFFGH